MSKAIHKAHRRYTVRAACHERWVAWLRANLPADIPPDEDAEDWPATFGDMVNGKPVHQTDEGEGYCFQCLHCRFYQELRGMLGMDWGVCMLPDGQFDGRVVFEHWTCRGWQSEDADR